MIKELILASLCWQTSLLAAPEPSARGMVATAHPLATAAGLEVLRQGGNAIDAAVAVGLTIGVVDPQNSGIGGGCFMLIHLADGTNVGVDGREMAPAAATRDMFLRHGAADPALSQTGALAIGVPGELAAFDYALRRWGKKSLRELILPAADLAEKGFAIRAGCASALKSSVAELKLFPETAAIYLTNGAPLRRGKRLRENDLAGTYRHIASLGPAWFYQGPFAHKVEEWMQAHGGLLTVADFKNYAPEARETIATTYRGCEVISFPPPSSGGVHMLEMLNILQHFDLAKMDQPTRLHVEAEAMKLAFADRAYWLGDPAYAQVPRGLIDPGYGAELAAKINLDHTTTVPGHGFPPQWQSNWFKKHTTHFCVADEAGNWVSCTATVNTSFGSKVVIPGTGVVMNNEMDDFSAQPGMSNYFGLIGAEANAVGPGKRPLSSMTPTIVLRGGKPILELGAAGGPRIITTVLQELVDILDLGMSPAQAVAAPRIHQQWSPDELLVEANLPREIRTALVRRGHHLKEFKALAVSQIVARSADGKSFIGAADPRGGGSAAGL